MRLHWVMFIINNHGCWVHGLLDLMNIVPETIMPYIVKNPNTIVVALCIKTITFFNIVGIVGKAMVNRPFSKHSILHWNHLSSNVKLAHRFAKQHTRLLETRKVVFVSKAVNNEWYEFAWQVADVDSASLAELASLAYHHCFLLIAFLSLLIAFLSRL